MLDEVAKAERLLISSCSGFANGSATDLRGEPYETTHGQTENVISFHLGTVSRQTSLFRSSD